MELDGMYADPELVRHVGVPAARGSPTKDLELTGREALERERGGIRAILHLQKIVLRPRRGDYDCPEGILAPILLVRLVTRRE